MSHVGVVQREISQDGLPRPPILLRFRSSKWFIGFASFTATFTDGILYSIIVPLLPFTLVERSGIAPGMVQFWITLFFIVFGSSMLLGAPIAGWVTQHSSLRQLPLVTGLIAAFAATLLFMLATATWILVLARCLQGISAGVVYTTVLALLVESVERDEVGSWVGFALSGVNLGTLIAPVLAGIVYENVGYYAVFAICLAILTFDLILALLLVDKKRARKWSSDSKQAGNGSKHRNSDSTGHINEESDDSNDSDYLAIPTPDGKNGRFANDRKVTITACPDSQSHEASPLLVNGSSKAKIYSKQWFPTTRTLLASPQILAALYGTFANSTLITSFDAVLPRFVQHTFHWSPSGAGLTFLTITVPSLLNPLFGALSDRYGRRIVALGGFALAVPSLALLGLVQTAELSDKLLLCVFLVLIGTGMNSFLTSLVTDMSFAVERLEQENPEICEDAGAFTEAYALVDCTFGAGAVIGPLISGLLYERTTWAITGGVLAVFCFSGSVPVMFYTYGSLPKKHREPNV